MAHTDIVADGWVARLPPAWRPFVLLMRLDRPIGAWLLFLPGLWGILLGAGWDTRLILLFALGAVVMRGAGCVVNDLWDRDLDRRVPRTAGRPLASGAVTPLQALVFLAALCLIGLAILVQLNRLAIVLGVASLALIAVYPLMKRVTWWPQAMLGITFGWGAPMGYAAATGGFDAAGAALYAAAFFWILGYDTIYAHQDREDDALIGIRSTARLFERRTRLFLTACYGAALLLLALAGLMAGATWPFFLWLAAPATLLGWQVLTLDIGDPAGCLRRFRNNREVGLLIALAFWTGFR